MWDIFSNAAANLIAGGLLAILTPVAYLLFRRFRTPAPVDSISGDWHGVIFDGAGKITKTDTFRLTRAGDRVVGTIQRTFPTEQTARNWKFEGRIQTKSFYAIYWSDDPLNISSGCWFLRQVDDRTFDGFYFRNQHDSEDAAPILSVPMIITRRTYDIHQSHDEILGKTRPKTRAGRRAETGETVVFLDKRNV